MCNLAKLRFLRMGSIWKVGGSSDRDDSSGGDERLFFVSRVPARKNIFTARGCFDDVAYLL